MPINILMPALSPTMEKGNLAKWLKKEGDKVKSGDVIAEIETDKATMEVEAVDEGTLAKIMIPEGTENVAVNTPIALLAGEDEDAAAVAKPGGAKADPSPAPPPPAAKAPEPVPASPRPAAPQPQAAPAAEADWTGKTVKMTVRDALRDAMAEEMRRDETVFLMGEEVAEYQGAYKVSQGLLEEFGERRVIDTPITEHAFT